MHETMRGLVNVRMKEEGWNWHRYRTQVCLRDEDLTQY